MITHPVSTGRWFRSKQDSDKFPVVDMTTRPYVS